MARTKKQKDTLDTASIMAVVLGVIGMLLAYAAIADIRHILALTGMCVGCFSIWAATRAKSYQYVPMGVLALLLGLYTVWSFSSYAT